jgi:diguanylate cyclase
VAEGIEDPETWAALRSAGATVAQGFVVARPMPAGELAAWAAGWAADRPAWAHCGAVPSAPPTL